MSASPKTRDVLQLAAARLSRAAPNSWIEFIDAFVAYSRDRTDDCVHAPSDKVLVTQGKARQCADLLTLFNEAAKQK